MKKLFQAIRKKDIETVSEIISQNPALINCVAKQPPKKDDGQSPLQIAFKTGSFEIANLLIEKGANVNFIEIESVNEWRAPVIHDAIRACILSSRYEGYGGIQNSKERFENALNSLKKIIENGANIEAIDSYGNTCMMRATLDANQLTISDNTKELNEDLEKVFNLLIRSGGDINKRTESRKSPKEMYGHRPVAKFFK